MNFPGILLKRQLLPVFFFLSLTKVMGQTTIDVSSACITGTATLTQTTDEAGKPAFTGTGTVNGNSVNLAIYWSPGFNTWSMTFDGQTFFYYEGNTDSPPNNNYSNWKQTSEGQSSCNATNKIEISGSGTQQDPLPVTLVSFDGRLSEKDIVLEWKTTEELDNKGFEILHSVDMKFWRALGTVSGNGTTQIRQAYTFIHSDPPGGLNYYRLKQIDFSGKTTLSNVIRVNNPVPSLAVYPNPVTDKLFFYGDDGANWKNGEILDMQGKYVQSIKPGKTGIPNLPAGKYMIRLVLQNGIPTALPFVKGN